MPTSDGQAEANIPPIEASPLWSVVVILGEIAARVCRRQAEEPEPQDLDLDHIPGEDAA